METIMVDVHEALKGLKLKVRLSGMKEWRVRLWIAKQLIRLAAFIMWADIELTEDL